MKCLRGCFTEIIIVFIILLGLIALTGCTTTENKELIEPQEFIDTAYAFLEVGSTDREEVLIRMGLPSAQFENERILTYQLVPSTDGRWHIRAPSRDFESGFRVWEMLTCSLVLVFDDEGVLERFSLVLPNEYKETDK